MTDQHTNHHEEEADRLFAAAQLNPIIIGLKNHKAMAELLDKDQLKELFSQESCCLGCSDGRIHKHRLGRAGMGIVSGVYEDESTKALRFDMDKAVESTAACLAAKKKPGSKIIVDSHDGCGAAGIIHSVIVASGENPGVAHPDELGIRFRDALVVKLQSMGFDASVGHNVALHSPVEAENEDRMDEIHDELGIYFDNTCRLNLEKLKNGEDMYMPNGFIFSGFGFNDEETVLELSKLTGIAMGSHGLGKKNFETSPFRIIISAESSEELFHMKSLANEVAKEYGPDLVKVETLLVPKFE